MTLFFIDVVSPIRGFVRGVRVEGIIVIVVIVIIVIPGVIVRIVGVFSVGWIRVKEGVFKFYKEVSNNSTEGQEEEIRCDTSK